MAVLRAFRATDIPSAPPALSATSLAPSACRAGAVPGRLWRAVGEPHGEWTDLAVNRTVLAAGAARAAAFRHGAGLWYDQLWPEAAGPAAQSYASPVTVEKNIA